MIEYKAYHKKSLGKNRPARVVRRKGKERPGDRGSASASRMSARQTMLLVVALLSVVIVSVSGAMAYAWLGRSALFTVREIDMNPCAHVTRDEVWGTLKGAPQGNIWRLSTRDIGRRLREHPWVQDVSVRKAFPDTLIVRITERRAVAMINSDTLWYVDAGGTIFKRLSAYDPKNFPIITGFDRRELASTEDVVTRQNLKRTIDLLKVAESGPLGRNISEIHFDAQEGFTLVTRDNGLQLKLGTVDLKDAVRRIDSAIPKLAGIGPGSGVVDLKTDGRIFIRPGE
ncbi:MAG TPA: FtsQ-type POTRA domain-containing protein [Candidatus Deferrimicrobiaceae bacterium]|jgi:cell division septal protein FtsQ